MERRIELSQEGRSMGETMPASQAVDYNIAAHVEPMRNEVARELRLPKGSTMDLWRFLVERSREANRNVETAAD
jgi:hypothetical protein